MKFFSKHNGTVFTMPDGKRLEFDLNREFETDDPKEIKELTHACKSHQMSTTPVKAMVSDAKILRDVSAPPAGKNTGPQTSQSTAKGLTATSG